MGRAAHPELHECAMLIGWTLKDMGWILLCAPLSVPAALLAFCAEAHLVATSWREATYALLVHHFADGCWLLGNTVWMLAEFLYEEGEEDHPGRQFPWYEGPLLGVNSSAYIVGLSVSRAIFLLGLVALLAFYILCYMGRASLDGKATTVVASDEVSLEEVDPLEARNYEARQACFYGTAPQQMEAAKREERVEPLVFGVLPPSLYLHLFIGPWIAKDLAWTFELKAPLVFFSLVTILLGIDYVRRYGGEVVRAELLWMIGDTMWAYGEVWQHDWKILPRDVAAIFLVLALVNVAGGATRMITSAGEAGNFLLAVPRKGEGRPLL